MSSWPIPAPCLRVAALQGGFTWLAGLLLGELAAVCVAAGLVVGTLSVLLLSRDLRARQEGAARRLLLFYRHERCLRRLLERRIAELGSLPAGDTAHEGGDGAAPVPPRGGNRRCA